MSECIFCSKTLKLDTSKYCSTQCQQDKNWSDRKKKFEEIHSKRYLKETSICCEICGTTEWYCKCVIGASGNIFDFQSRVVGSIPT